MELGETMEDMLPNETLASDNGSTFAIANNSDEHLYDHIYFIIYFVILPIIFIVGIPGNVAVFFLLAKRARHEASYLFHCLISLNAAFCLAGCALIMGNWYWFQNMLNLGPLWIRQSQIFTYSSAYIFDQLCNVLITAAPCLTLLCSLDRLLAMHKPIEYMAFGNAARRHVIFISCIIMYVVGFLLSISDMFRYYVVFDDTTKSYMVFEDSTYVAKLAPKVLAACRSGLRIVVIVLVICINVLIMKKYKSILKNRRKIHVFHKHDESKRNKDEITLALMLFVQALLMIGGHVPMSISYILIYVDQTNSASFGRKYFNMFVNVSFAAEMACIFVVLLFTNKKFTSSICKLRRRVFHGSRTMHRFSTEIPIPVTPVTPVTGPNSPWKVGFDDKTVFNK